MPESCSIYLLVPARTSPDLEKRFEAAVARGHVASALIGADGEGLVDRAAAARLMVHAHAHDVAFLLEADVAAAAALGADGVHIASGEADCAEARRALGGDAIVGAACGPSRHEAMLLAEAGADYVAFAIEDPERQAELVSWWAELFEVPSVAWDVPDMAHAVRLASCGADFVAIRDTFWSGAEAPGEAIAALRHALADARAAA